MEASQKVYSQASIEPIACATTPLWSALQNDTTGVALTDGGRAIVRPKSTNRQVCITRKGAPNRSRFLPEIVFERIPVNAIFVDENARVTHSMIRHLSLAGWHSSAKPTMAE